VHAELHRLSKRYYRQTGTREAGSGAGLSIVRRIAEVHGGRLKFHAAEIATELVVSVRPPAGDHAALPRRNPG
jgi:two-component system sensor histidine kinase QseC